MNILELTLHDQKRALVFTRGAMSEEARHTLDCQALLFHRDQTQIHATITQDTFGYQQARHRRG